MLVTVITPSFNSGSYIEDTIRSVAEQDYGSLDHIVLDSNSTDATHDVLTLARRQVIRDAPPTIAGKINLGFRLARGDILMWLNADDVLAAGAVGRAVAALERRPDVGLVYSNFMNIDESGQVTARWPSRQCTARDLIERHDWIPHQTAFLRKEAAESVGGVDPSSRWCSTGNSGSASPSSGRSCTSTITGAASAYGTGSSRRG